MDRKTSLLGDVRRAEYRLGEHYKSYFIRKSSCLNLFGVTYSEEYARFTIYFNLVTPSGLNKTIYFTFKPNIYVKYIKLIKSEQYVYYMRYNSNICTIDHLIETLDFFIDKFLSGFRREVIAKYYLEKMMSLYPVITGVRYANEEEDRKATDLIVETNFPKTGPVTVPLQIKSSSAMQIKHRKGFFSRKIPSIVVPNTHAFDLLAPKLFDVIRTYVLSGQVLHLSLHRDKVKPSS